jgi:Na+/serine symporter
VSRYGATSDAEINNALMGRAETITGLTLYSAGTDSFVDNDTRVLLGADPSVSGCGNHDYGVAGGSALLVTVVTSNDYAGRAEEILKNNGGKL